MDLLCRFIHAWSHRRRPEKCLAMLAGVLAHATKLGPKRVAGASKGISAHQIGWKRTFHARSETYRAAQACITDAHTPHPHSCLWGNGTTSSSDGQFFVRAIELQSAAKSTCITAANPDRSFIAICQISTAISAFCPSVRPGARRPMCSMRLFGPGRRSTSSALSRAASIVLTIGRGRYRVAVWCWQ